jgi:hypothetical protein
MPGPGPRFPRSLPESMRRRLEVATAMAWEALVDTHTEQALEFIELFQGRITLEDALLRYLREMDLNEATAGAIRTRVFVALEDRPSSQRPRLQLDDDTQPEPPDDATDGWRRFRPDVIVRGVRERQKRTEETEHFVELALARCEEALIKTHIDNAITFAALLDGTTSLKVGVQTYLGAVNLAGGRSQSVFQRTMAQLADVHLPPTQPHTPAD